MRAVKGALAALVVWAAVSVASAQTGGLKVVVTDGADRSPLPGAIVTLTHELGYVKETNLQTDADGVALFPVLRPGKGYRIRILMSDYSPYDSGAEVPVRIGAPLTWPVGLVPVMREVVKVTGKTEVVDLEENQSATTFGSEFIQDLPVPGRFYQNVLTLAPGVSDDDGDGNPNVNGARARDFKANVSGVSNQDPLTGGFLNLVNPDSIEEIEVVTSGAGVEYGGAQGGFANIVQKQGSNDFEGVANFLFRSSKLDGNGANGQIRSEDLADFKQYQPALQVSGPILRDKLWYRLSHEYHYIDEPVNTIGQIAVRSTRRQVNDDLITWQASPRNKLQFQYRSDPLDLQNVDLDSTLGPDSAQRWKRSGPTAAITWDAPFSTNLLMKSLVSYQDNQFEYLPTTEGLPNDCVSAAEGISQSLASAYCFNATTGQVSGSYFRTWRDSRQRLTVRSEGEHFATKLWGFDQRIKFGLNIENQRFARDLTERPTIFFFTFRPNAQEAGGDNDLDPVGIAVTDFPIPQTSYAKATSVNYSIYGSDQISLLSNLTATVGLRVDRENIQAKGKQQFDPQAQADAYLAALATCTGANFTNCVGGLNREQLLRLAFTSYEGIVDLRSEMGQILGVSPEQVHLSNLSETIASWPDRRQLDNIDLNSTNISPYLGVTWDPFKDGKTKLSASLGRHYGGTILYIPLAENEPAHFFTEIETKFIGGQQTIPPGALGSISPTSADITVVDRNLSTPYQDEFSLAIERELWAESSLKLTYLKRRFKDQFQDIDINHAPGDYGRCNYSTNRGGWFVEPSPGVGESFTDPWTHEVYQDSDPGAGDGRWDDCNGDIELLEPVPGEEQVPVSDRLLNTPDGVPDAYLLNPSWGSIYLLGNYNTADYSSYSLEFVRRQYKGWQMEASYTYARAVGDAEDYNQLAGDDRSNAQFERSFLSYDRRHSVKINATTITPWGFRLGSAVKWESGLPYSILENRFAVDSLPPAYATLEENTSRRVRLVYPTRKRNDQRNRSSWNFDVNAAREFNLKGGMNLQLRAEVFNLFNKDTLHVLQNRDETNAQFRDFGRSFQISTRLAF